MIFRSTLAAAAPSLVSVALAADKTIDPSSVPLATREQWCTTQKESCPLICKQTKPGTTEVNTCDPEALTYGCLCGDNKQPNVSEYSLTLPYFVCLEWGNQCVSDCANDNKCAQSCREDNPCGATDPERVDPSSTSSGTVAPTASATDDPNAIYTDSPGGGGSSGGDSGAAAALAVGRAYGLAIVLGGMFAGFALL